MFSINKIFDKEWYHRKKMILLSIFLESKSIEEIDLRHRISLTYKTTFGTKLHWYNPKTFNEKLIWLSWYWRHPLKTLCADKYKVRDYVTKICGLPGSLLVPLYGVYNNADEINFDVLPNEFVLKCNHGCAYNILVRDKSSLNIIDTKIQLNNWLSEIYMGGIAELHYKGIEPHIIMCEQMLPSSNESSSIMDYKIHCINGEPRFILLCYDRDENEVAQLATFDLNWNQIFYCVGEKIVQIKRPSSLDKMIEYSKVLSNAFPFVRVDFYDVDGTPYLGELTFTPYGNMIDYYTKDTLLLLGAKLKLPKKYI